ncbi:hypothetical protein Hanom_Chr12g01180981 [Helianthus anomalus]
MSQSGSSIPLIGSSIPASDGPYISISDTLVSSLRLLITVCKSSIKCYFKNCSGFGFDQ